MFVLCLCYVCVPTHLGLFYSFSRIRKLRNLRNISVPQITTEILITIMIIAKFKERASKVLGTAVAQWLRCSATNRKVSEFYIDIILPIALWPWGRLNLQQKWVPGGFPGSKCGLCVRLTTLPPSCAVVMKSGNLNFLEPSGPIQACNGTALRSKVLHMEHSFVWCWNLDTSESRSEISWEALKFGGEED